MTPGSIKNLAELLPIRNSFTKNVENLNKRKRWCTPRNGNTVVRLLIPICGIVSGRIRRCRDGDHSTLRIQTFCTHAIKTCPLDRIRFVPVRQPQKVLALRGAAFVESSGSRREGDVVADSRVSRPRQDSWSKAGPASSRVPANYEADTADKRSEGSPAICIPRRETIVSGILCFESSPRRRKPRRGWRDVAFRHPQPRTFFTCVSCNFLPCWLWLALTQYIVILVLNCSVSTNL